MGADGSRNLDDYTNGSPGSAAVALVFASRKMTFVWILLAIVYVVCWVYFGLTTFRKGHYWLFWIGFLFPILWIIGALIGPTPRVAARAGGTA